MDTASLVRSIAIRTTIGLVLLALWSDGTTTVYMEEDMCMFTLMYAL